MHHLLPVLSRTTYSIVSFFLLKPRILCSILGVVWQCDVGVGDITRCWLFNSYEQFCMSNNTTCVFRQSLNNICQTAELTFLCLVSTGLFTAMLKQSFGWKPPPLPVISFIQHVIFFYCWKSPLRSRHGWLKVGYGILEAVIGFTECTVQVHPHCPSHCCGIHNRGTRGFWMHMDPLLVKRWTYLDRTWAREPESIITDCKFANVCTFLQHYHIHIDISNSKSYLGIKCIKRIKRIKCQCMRLFSPAVWILVVPKYFADIVRFSENVRCFTSKHVLICCWNSIHCLKHLSTFRGPSDHTQAFRLGVTSNVLTRWLSWMSSMESLVQSGASSRQENGRYRFSVGVSE